ncbi:carbamoyltransferase HypF [Donghicola tyrosinivorans]|uniref:Carbamoyltransferase HypF n=1 Tax=Donghicola tyrosinivorans TaxID=1652492 RepID=A0A2T0WLZ3_9RHOB|nr:carbamoyltransferase HypF [Donghicola tyrosinivorans]PRY87716.1 hydrogenase maturation protein HypF [Donghicola tyrosinivorans]
MEGLRIRVRGQVQGVGFRPFVWLLARELGVTGRVLNDPEGVLIEAYGPAATLPDLLRTKAPPLSRIDGIEVTPITGEAPTDFVIAASEGSGAETRVTPDAATCPDCLEEIHNPSERRFGYAFANCTHCGPRFTILNALPYDRSQTTMAPFAMCADCAAEYTDPADRRFHAQPVACPACGPKVWIEPHHDAPLAEAAARLHHGEILAIKGLGGFHLAGDARNAGAIALLRQRKMRPAKPFALMGTLDTIRQYAAPSDAEVALLQDPAAPIVLLANRGSLPSEIAPNQSTLGWMLPYTPLHHLLLDLLDGPLVMTSGNLSGEPQVIGNEEAREKLAPFVDAFLMHDRDIARRIDDSVERITPHGPMVLRRARGRVPGTLPLPKGFEDAPQTVAYGGQMKAALCLIKNGQALLGHHLGELDEALTWEAFQQADRDYSDLFDHKPQVVAVDLHPDFRASRHGAARAEAEGLKLEEIQHHHAHLAACMGENLWPLDGGEVAGIILDGVGLGPDGTVWGGEVLLGDYTGYERAAWLRPAPLIGGDMAAKEPWRNALARLDQAGLPDWADALFPDKPLAMARMAAERGLNTPQSSSAGRLFDAVAACLGICPDRQSYEGEAAMTLEALAQKAPPEEMAFYYDINASGSRIDPAKMWEPLRNDLENGVSTEIIALRFHSALARAFACAAVGLVQQGRARAIALSGGCFQSALLLDLTCHWIEAEASSLGIKVPVMHHTKTPANDGGLALGQALIAAARHLG